MDTPAACTLLPATADDTGPLLAMIRALADYERLTQLVTATETALARSLFGDRPAAEALIAWESEEKREARGFALFFHNFSTFLARPGLWLEDIFVYPQFRRHRIGERLLAEVGAIARARDCGRLEWAVLDWNAPAIAFYRRMGATVMPDWRVVRVTGTALERFGRDEVGDHH